jgi:hypothetical protein|nr:MAG TPA: hypothetical protein [Crassvirales sp.]
MPNIEYIDYEINNYFSNEYINTFSWQYSFLTTYTTNTAMPNTNPVLENSEVTTSPLSTRGMMEERTGTPVMPEPQDFSSAAEYDRAMRRYLAEYGSITEQQIIKEKNINTSKELLSFIKFVKDQLKDNVNKSSPDGLNLIEDLLSEDKMKEIVDNYFC